jgi:hypothetical protein
MMSPSLNKTTQPTPPFSKGGPGGICMLRPRFESEVVGWSGKSPLTRSIDRLRMSLCERGGRVRECALESGEESNSPAPQGNPFESPSPRRERGWGEGGMPESIHSRESITSPFDAFAKPSPTWPRMEMEAPNLLESFS